VDKQAVVGLKDEWDKRIIQQTRILMCVCSFCVLNENRCKLHWLCKVEWDV